jgi:hypothetical protein
VPDSYDEHVKLMFDMQVVAFASDVTRVVAFKLSRDVSNRVYPETGVNTGFHIASHHGEREERILDLAKINKYHVGLVPYFLKKLKETPDGDSNLLENSLLIYGSPMGNSNVHNHKRCPLFLAGHAGGALKGNMHIKAADGTPMANAMLGALRGVGLELDTFGDSSAVMDLNKAPEATVAYVGGSFRPACGWLMKKTHSRTGIDPHGNARGIAAACRRTVRHCRRGAGQERRGGEGAPQRRARRECRPGRRHDGAALGSAARRCRGRRKCCFTPGANGRRQDAYRRLHAAPPRGAGRQRLCHRSAGRRRRSGRRRHRDRRDCLDAGRHTRAAWTPRASCSRTAPIRT